MYEGCIAPDVTVLWYTDRIPWEMRLCYAELLKKKKKNSCKTNMKSTKWINKTS